MPTCRSFSGRWRCLAGLVFAVSLAAAPACAQPQPPSQLPSPRLAVVSPCGVKAGGSVDVVISGADLEGATRLLFDHPGLRFAPVVNRYWRSTSWHLPNTFRITAATDVPVGLYEVRAVGTWGVSNPRWFVVGDQNEEMEREPNNDPAQAQRVELGTTVNGVINPNIDADYYVFPARKGQRVLIVCLASSIDSRAEPLLQLYSASRRLLKENRNHDGRDAVLDFVVPADGDYLVRLVEHTHLSGGAEHFYRLSIGLTPWIDAAYPPVVERGRTTAVTLFGRNLPNGHPDPVSNEALPPLDRLTIQVSPPTDPEATRRADFGGPAFSESAIIDGTHLRVKNAAGASNTVPLSFAAGPVILDNDTNDTPEKAQEIPLPCDIAGRVERRRDRDWYAFTAKQNDVWVFEGFASRLGSAADLHLEIYRVDPKTNVYTLLVESDDQADTTSPLRFPTRTDDPYLRFAAPANGKYLLRVTSRDADLSAGPRHVYHLAVRREQPDFRLVVVDRLEYNPSALNLWRGGAEAMEVYCYRRDGFVGEVTLSVEGLPKGVVCPPQVIGPNTRVTSLVFVAASDAPPWTGSIKVKGTASIGGQTVVREARPACMVVPVQPGVTSLSRLTRSLQLCVIEHHVHYALKPSVEAMEVPVGGTAVFRVKAEPKAPEVKGAIALLAVALPTLANQNPPIQGQALPAIAAGAADAEIRLNIANNMPPGVYNLVLRGSTQIPFNKDPKAPNKPNINAAVVAPPIRLVVYNQVAEVSLSAPQVDVRAGEKAELTVKVKRLFNYQAPLRVQVIVPQGFQGVAAAEVPIPEKETEAKLVLTSPRGSKPAANPNFIVRVTATVGTQTFTHDAQLAVNLLPSRAWYQIYMK